MPHALWTGSINFGLVTIPVKLFTAVRGKDLSFHYLHKKDRGRINNVRTCSLCHRKVAWSDIVRGYEVRKGEYVLLDEEDFKRVNPEATQSVDIVQFVNQKEIDPMLYDTPYYLEPDKRGRHAYALLREALKKSGKVGIARVVIRTREHLAALRPHGPALVLETMRYASELAAADEFDLPPVKVRVPAPEMKAALMLIDTMTDRFAPEQFRDEYREQLLTMIRARAQGKKLPKVRSSPAQPTNVVNIMDVLQRSLTASRTRTRGARKSRTGGERVAAG